MWLARVRSGVEFVVYGPLRSATGTDRVEVPFDGGTVADAVAAFVEAYPRAADQLFDEDGATRPSVRVVREGARVEPDEPCTADDSLTLFPAIRGG